MVGRGSSDPLEPHTLDLPLRFYCNICSCFLLIADLSGDLSCPSEAWKPLCTWKLPESLPVDERQESCAAKNSDYVYETESCEYGKSFHLTNEIFETSKQITQTKSFIAQTLSMTTR